MPRCIACRKSLLKCGCWSTTETKTARPGKRGKNTTRNGIEWCGRRSCRVLNNRCSNVQCSTRQEATR